MADGFLPLCADVPTDAVGLVLGRWSVPGGGQQPQHLAEQPAQRPLVPGPEPGDGRMIRVQLAASKTTYTRSSSGSHPRMSAGSSNG